MTWLSGVSCDSPSATARSTMSRSVIMPTSFSLALTGMLPISRLRISSAALRMLWSCSRTTTSLLITVWIFMAISGGWNGTRREATRL